MNGRRDNPFQSPGSWQVPEKLLALGKPRHEMFADFIQECSPDPATRTVATTALVLSFWQLKGPSLSLNEVPSMLLLPAGESGDDPIDSFVGDLVYDAEENKPRVQTEGAFVYAPIERAPEAMKTAFLSRQALGRDLPANNTNKYYQARNAEEKFHAARVTGFGYGCCRPYAEAWHPEYGLLTDEDDRLILRLKEESDRAAFCHDLVEEPRKLAFAEGIGSNLFMVEKNVSLSGSLTPEEWQGRTVGATITLGWPLFALPHFAEAPLQTGKGSIFSSLAMIWKGMSVPPVVASPRLPASDWVRTYETALRRRLRNLPATYEFTVLQAVHQLDGVCDRIAKFAAGGGVGLAEMVALCKDLYEHTLRGPVLGIVGLSWHGRGLYLGPEAEPFRAKGMKLLDYLREKGPTSRSALLQGCHLKKPQRDVLLGSLVTEGLVKVDGAMVSATTYAEFVRALYLREEFPPVTNNWAAMREKQKATA